MLRFWNSNAYCIKLWNGENIKFTPRSKGDIGIN